MKHVKEISAYCKSNTLPSGKMSQRKQKLWNFYKKEMGNFSGTKEAQQTEEEEFPECDSR